MKATNVLMLVAVVAVGLAVFNLVLTVNKIGELTGLAVTDTGNVSLEVISNLAINFTTDAIDWSTGYVTSTIAHLYTNGTNTGDSASFTVVSSPLVLANIGNENANLTLNANNNASAFIAGTSPLYEINLTESTGVGQDCSANLQNNNTWVAMNTTATLYCGNFTKNTGVFNIHVHVAIPDDSPIGTKTSVITATAEVIV